MIRLILALAWACSMGTSAFAELASSATPTPEWRLASTQGEGDSALEIYVEAERSPGNPAFRIETSFQVAPFVAATTLMHEMIGSRDLPRGQRRKVLERSDREVVVHTLVELPLMLSDREIAVRIRHSDDEKTGVHRVDFEDVNELLPVAKKGVVRLDGTGGYWEFRPDGAGRTSVTYVTRAAVGGSIPSMISHRLMKAEAIDAVQRLHRLLAARRRTHVAGPAPPNARIAE